jgi:hypothetical protein
MKAQILYVDDHRTTRDQRWDAGDGKVLPPECYTQVDECAVPEGPAIQACEAIFESRQAVDGPVKNHLGLRIRSMSVGDLVVLGNERFICSPVGFQVA